MNQSGPVRVLLVENNLAMQRLVAQVLPPAFTIIDALRSGETLQATVEAHHPDVIVLDITLPGQSGIVVARQLRKSGCRSGVVFLTMHHDADFVRSALDAGANGYVFKLRLASDLEPAIWAAVHGECFISPLQD
jgi:DNA-binding NarL/FixJ family response regulator